MKGYILNGDYIEGERLSVDPREPYFAHGEGLFETLRGKGGKPCYLEPHVVRMAATARELGLPLHFDSDAIRGQIEELLRRNGLDDARVKLHLLKKSDGDCDLLVTAVEEPEMPPIGEPVAIGRVSPRFNGMMAMPGLKTMNYMVNRLAEAEGRERGFGEVLFTKPDDRVMEGTRSTVFFVKDGVLATPPLDMDILPGVTRGIILRLAEELGIPTEREPFPFSALQEADEAFLTASVSGVRPVSRVEDRELPGAPGPVTIRLAEAYREDFGRSPEV